MILQLHTNFLKYFLLILLHQCLNVNNATIEIFRSGSRSYSEELKIFEGRTDALADILKRRADSDCPTEPLENKWIGSIHAPFTPDWIRSPLLKVAAASERTTKGLENVWKTLAIPIYRQALSLAAHTLLSRQVADDRSIIQFSYRRHNFFFHEFLPN